MRGLLAAVMTAASLFMAGTFPAWAQSPSPESLLNAAISGRPDRGATGLPGATEQQSTHAREADSRFLRRHEDGWFWYEDPPPTVAKKLPIPPKSEQTDPSKKKDAPLSVEWIRNNIDRLRDQAINNPTKENVEMFLYVHKYMMDLSERFAYTYRSVAEGNMALDETIANPVTAVSRREISDATERAQNEILNKLADKIGIWYFFQSTCPYCLRQNPILDYLQQDAPLSILAISLDGLPMVDGSHPNWVVDNGQGQQLQVSTTPTLFLVKPDTNDVVLLAAGLRSLPELKQRIVEVSYNQKWISKMDYESAMHGLPRRLLTDGVELNEIKPGATDKELLEVMRRGGIHGGVEAVKKSNEGGSTPWGAE